MLTRFITDVTAAFNPFSPRARSVRLFLAQLPPSIRAPGGAKVVTTLRPRTSAEPSVLVVKFKDGKEMKLDVENTSIKTLVEEVDRHSRALQKQADLTE